MSKQQVSIFDGDSAGYRRALEQALDDHLDIVRRHAAGHDHELPWEFDAAITTVRWLADELRRIAPQEPEEPLPF